MIRPSEILQSWILKPKVSITCEKMNPKIEWHIKEVCNHKGYVKFRNND